MVCSSSNREKIGIEMYWDFTIYEVDQKLRLWKICLTNHLGWLSFFNINLFSFNKLAVIGLMYLIHPSRTVLLNFYHMIQKISEHMQTT